MNTEIPHIKTDKQLVPEIRFREFSKQFEEKRLSDLMVRHSDNNKDEEFDIDGILSLSVEHGIVDRRELLEDTYSKVNHKNYIKVRINDFVYGKSISAKYPYGVFKSNNLRDGLLSTLYFTFTVYENADPNYLECYFSHFHRANNFLRKYVLVGDRYITADPDYILSGKIHIPSRVEQQKIASFLSTVDTKLRQLTQKKELLQQYKKGVMQQLFPSTGSGQVAQLRFKKEDGSDYPDWEEKKLREIAERVAVKNVANEVNFVLTNSATQGIVSQQDYFDKDIANQNNLQGYYIVSKDDFVYNPRISTSAPVGPIKRNKLQKGVMSPLYSVFRFNEPLLEYFEHYFETINWHRYLHSVANFGARHDRMNITNSEFFKMPIPMPCFGERKKITHYLSALDTKIETLTQQIENTQLFKKGLLQQMFV